MIRGHAEVHPDAEAWAAALADGFASRARAAVEARGRFVAVLTGGGSPAGIFRRLAEPDVARRVPWDGVHLLWGDERCVPPAHPRSNFGMAHRLLLRHVPIPESNLHRMRGELGARRAAKAYQTELRELFAEWPPRADLVHLGLGDDGHVASLFPFDRATVLSDEARVLTSFRMPEAEPRVSLSFGILNAAARVEILLPEAGKSGIAARAMHGPLDPVRLPVQRVAPRDGALAWAMTEAVRRRVEEEISAA